MADQRPLSERVGGRGWRGVSEGGWGRRPRGAAAGGDLDHRGPAICVGLGDATCSAWGAGGRIFPGLADPRTSSGYRNRPLWRRPSGMSREEGNRTRRNEEPDTPGVGTSVSIRLTDFLSFFFFFFFCYLCFNFFGTLFWRFFSNVVYLGPSVSVDLPNC